MFLFRIENEIVDSVHVQILYTDSHERCEDEVVKQRSINVTGVQLSELTNKNRIL